jgi:hypothetical protein
VSPLEYVAASLDHWDLYALLAVLFLALHWILIRRWVVGIYDPLFLILIANAFGWTIVWFMFLQGDIAAIYVVTFTVSQIALYIGIGMGRVIVPRGWPMPGRAESLAVPQLTLMMAATAHISSTLVIWAIAGIPLFRESRLGAFLGSGGLGGIERLADSSALIAAFSLLYILIHWPRLRRNPLIVVFTAWYFTSIALSGSKGALMTFVQHALSLLFIYGNLRNSPGRFWGGAVGKSLIVVASFFAIAVLMIQRSSDLETAALGLLFRVISFGDVYIYAYHDATIEQLKGDNPLIGLFGGLLSTFRLFPVELVHANIGYQFALLIFPDLDVYGGPNPQHAVFGYHYFGHLAFIFSFALGILTSLSQSLFYRKQHTTFLGGLVAFMLYFAVVSISVDFDYTLSKMASMLIGLVVVVGPVLLLRPGTAIARRSFRMPIRAVDSNHSL